ncbi:MAG: agmatine deiminase family protein [Pirellula sp.]
MSDIISESEMIAGSAVDAGFRWVAEWVRHEATWIAWPHNERTWPGKFNSIPAVTERMVRILADVENVHVLGGSAESLRQANQALSDIENVTVHDIPTNDTWIRDFGPTFLLSHDGKKLGATRWRFNAWGNKYAHDLDALASERICKLLSVRGTCNDAAHAGMLYFSSNLVGEGGGIETDGEGTLLTTSSVLLASTRNFHWSRELVECELMRMLDIQKVLWVDGGALEGDDTDSHIDQLVRFVRPGLVVAAVSYSTDDSNADKLDLQRRRLIEMSDARGRPLDVIPLMTPPPRLVMGRRVPESYCNFYVANDIVLMPTFGFRETDDAAAGILRDLMPDRDIVCLDASDFIFGLGAFHCATQQQPAVLADD